MIALVTNPVVATLTVVVAVALVEMMIAPAMVEVTVARNERHGRIR